MVKHDIASFTQARTHFCQQSFVLNIICPVEILKIQMTRVPLPHSLGFQDKALRLRIHDIQKCFLVVEPGRKRFVQRIIDIFHIKCRYFLPVLYDRTLHGICPCAHIIQI